MVYLLMVSLIWAFSFGLIKGNLFDLDPNFAGFVRLALSFCVFAPFLRLKGISFPLGVKLTLIGAVQFGVMYTAYMHAYQHIDANQVALYTIFTPFYVTLVNDLLDRTFRIKALIPALIAILGTYLIETRSLGAFNRGFFLVQISNLCFAAGQVIYKRTMIRSKGIKDHQIFALLYLGAVLFTGAFSAKTTPWSQLNLTFTHIWTLLYLGILASGICFFLWNLGAKKVNCGALAVFNNIKIPLAVACAILFFNEERDIPMLLLGGTIIGFALVLNEVLVRTASKS